MGVFFGFIFTFIVMSTAQLCSNRDNYLNDYLKRDFASEFQQISVTHLPSIFGVEGFNKGISDKVIEHSYYSMYGPIMLPYIRRKHKLGLGVKIFEIGLGCDQSYGAGASVYMWQRILMCADAYDWDECLSMEFREQYLKSRTHELDEIWEVEFNIECLNYWGIENYERSFEKQYGMKFRALPGDQTNINDINSWKKSVDGQLDFIIDDGSHRQDSIFVSLTELWDRLAPGGYYFIEDLHVARSSYYQSRDPNLKINMIKVINEWIDQLVSVRLPERFIEGTVENIYFSYFLPPKVKSITCVYEACYLQKCEENDIAKYCNY